MALPFLLIFLQLSYSAAAEVTNSGNSSSALVPIPEDKFEGSKLAYVVCTKQAPGEVPKWDWIVLERGLVTNTYDMIKGTWETNMCTYGRVQAFHVAKAAYLGALRKCKALGYTAAQPSESTFGGWYPFKVGNVITGYYYKTDITQLGVYYPTTTLPACGAAGDKPVVIPNDEFAGGDSTYPVCVKCCRINDWDWLYISKGIVSSTYYTVQGQWIKHLCGFGYTSSFRISSADYNKFLKMCKDQGYETLQVAKTSSDFPSPVQVGNFYADTYILGTKYPAMVVPDCVASNDGAGNAGVIDSSSSNSAGDSSLGAAAPTSCAFPGQSIKVGEERNYQGYVYTCQQANNETNLVSIACLEDGDVVKHKPGENWVSGTKPSQYIFQCYKNPYDKLIRLVTKCLYDSADGKAEVEPGDSKVVGKNTITCVRTGENQLQIQITSSK